MSTRWKARLIRCGTPVYETSKPYADPMAARDRAFRVARSRWGGLQCEVLWKRGDARIELREIDARDAEQLALF